MLNFIAEVWVLLQAAGDGSEAEYTATSSKLNGTNQQSPQFYSRDDFCEVFFNALFDGISFFCSQIEPEIVACLLRMLTRYIREIESSMQISDSNSEDDEARPMNLAQKECFSNTVEVLQKCLRLLLLNFICDFRLYPQRSFQASMKL